MRIIPHITGFANEDMTVLENEMQVKKILFDYRSLLLQIECSVENDELLNTSAKTWIVMKASNVVKYKLPKIRNLASL